LSVKEIADMAQNPSFDDLLGAWPFTGPASMPITDPSQGSIGLLAAPPAQPAIGGVLGAMGDPSEAPNPWSPSGLAPSAPQPATPLAIARLASHGYDAGLGSPAAVRLLGPIGTAVDPTHIPGLPIAAASGSPQAGAGGFQPSPILSAVNAAIASGGEALTPSPDKSSVVVHPWSSGYVYSPTGRFEVSISNGSPPGDEMEPSGVKNPQTGEPVEATVPVLGETDVSLTNTSAPHAPFFGSQALGNTGLFTTRPTVGRRLPSSGGDIRLTNPSGAGWYFISNRNPLYQEGADIQVQPLPGKAGAGR
jgi:hypothetical protein